MNQAEAVFPPGERKLPGMERGPDCSGLRRGVARNRMRTEAGKMPESLISPIRNGHGVSNDRFGFNDSHNQDEATSLPDGRNPAPEEAKPATRQGCSSAPSSGRSYFFTILDTKIPAFEETLTKYKPASKPCKLNSSRFCPATKEIRREKTIFPPISIS